MTNRTTVTPLGLTEMTTQIVAAYVSHNSLACADLPKLIGDAYAALSDLTADPAQAPVDKPAPAVPIKKSITSDYLICLEDGKKFKSLKRHLRTQYDLSPADYREKWGLPSDYPMVAPSYSQTRSSLAKANGLGRKAKASVKPPRKKIGLAI